MTSIRQSQGFTLVEMLVVAPIVILAIGSFIAAIVGLTGEVLSSRGSNALAYDVQNALNQIEDDVKLSVGFLAVNDKDVAATSSGVNNSTTPYTNLGTTPNSQSLILNGIVTINNPAAANVTALYLNNKPENCANLSPIDYTKNTPMTMNIVYYTQQESNGEISLWRRVVMQSNYAQSATYCGSTGSWQKPTCNPFKDGSGSVPPLVSHCKAKDSLLLTGLDPGGGFLTEYFTSTTGTTPAAGAFDSDEATRKAALASASTVNITIKAKRSIAGRDIARTGSLRTTRLDTNASTIAYTPMPTSVPSSPDITMNAVDGHNVRVTWKKQDTVTSYVFRYHVKDAVTGVWGPWIDVPASQSATRSVLITNADHGDEVGVQIWANNALGQSNPPAAKNLIIPIWAPLTLSNGWQDYGSGYSPAAYTRTKSGMVIVRGLIKKGSAATLGEVIGQLPSDYAPGGGALMFGTTTSGDASAQIDISATGQITSRTGVNSNWVSLETIHYIAANAGYSRVAIGLQSGFINDTVNGYAPAAYIQDNTGRVNIQGRLANGTRTNGSVIWSIPTALRPAKYQHHASRSGTFHHLGIDNAAGLTAKGDGTGSYSINASYFPASYTTWTNLTLAGGWVSYDGGTQYSTPQYTKSSDNVVTLKGLIKSGGGYNTVLTTLPTGFRPKNRILYTTVNNGAFGRIDIFPNGEVRFMGSSNVWYALDDVMFLAEQ